MQEWTLLLKIKNKKINFHIFFLSFIALKKCTNLQNLWHPLKTITSISLDYVLTGQVYNKNIYLKNLNKPVLLFSGLVIEKHFSAKTNKKTVFIPFKLNLYWIHHCFIIAQKNNPFKNLQNTKHNFDILHAVLSRHEFEELSDLVQVWIYHKKEIQSSDSFQ